MKKLYWPYCLIVVGILMMLSSAGILILDYLYYLYLWTQVIL